VFEIATMVAFLYALVNMPIANADRDPFRAAARR
jgi:hypothetical protein